MLVVLGVIFTCGQVAQGEPIRVVTSIPDLADIASQIGGERITVRSLATGVENPHSVPMKPSFVSLLNRADVVIAQGLGLEHAFLPGLLEVARNPHVMQGMPGYIDCSIGIKALDVPKKLDRSQGEQHPDGNPHFNLSPTYGRTIAMNIANGLSKLYPADEEVFSKNLKAFLGKLDSAIEKWKVKGAPLKGVTFVSYHPDMAYLADFYGMIGVGTIEEKPGVDPTPSHIVELKETINRERVKLIIRERHYPASLAETLAQETGAHVADLSVMTGGLPDTKDYFSFIDTNLNVLLAALNKAQ